MIPSRASLAVAVVLSTLSVPGFAADPPDLGGKVPLQPGIAITRAGTAPSFLASGELLRVAGAQLASAKKNRKTSGEPPFVTFGVAAPRPAGTSINFFHVSSAQFSESDAMTGVYLKSTMSPTFVEGTHVPRAEISFPVRASNLYVLDCPVRGSSAAHHRVQWTATPGRASTYVTRETRSNVRTNVPATHLAERDGWVRVIVQGHTLDGEDYTWSIDACRLTTLAYG